MFNISLSGLNATFLSSGTSTGSLECIQENNTFAFRVSGSLSPEGYSSFEALGYIESAHL